KPDSETCFGNVIVVVAGEKKTLVVARWKKKGPCGKPAKPYRQA
ncbi:hypothetical protein HMPREF0294_0970, partial [Corynebacterium glucuronolyticum ATCC 51867]